LEIEKKLEALGLELPLPIQPPPGVRLPFASVRVHGNRAYIAGHGPQNPDGSIAGLLGKVGVGSNSRCSLFNSWPDDLLQR
jgi:hypothetical protein